MTYASLALQPWAAVLAFRAADSLVPTGRTSVWGVVKGWIWVWSDGGKSVEDVGL
jgi:hypothetical protein